MADSLGIPVTYPTVNARNLNAAMDMIDGLFLPITDADNITTILSQFAYYNIKTQLLGSAEWNNFNVLESNKPSAKGIIFCSDTYVDKGSARIKQFGEKYFAEMRKSPTRYSMFGYDTMDLLMHIIADGNTTREQVENALMKMPVFHGLHSTLTMGPERVNNTLNILQYKEGGIKKLGEVAVH